MDYENQPRVRDENLLAQSRKEEIRLWIDLLVMMYHAIFMFLQYLKEIFIRRPMKDVRGQVAFITGAAKGLGREMALVLAKKGCNIAVVDMDIENAKRTAADLEDLGVKAKAYKADVSKSEDIDAIAPVVEKELGPVDIVINNAGVFFTKSIETETPEKLQKMVNINMMSSMWTTRAFLQGMIDRKRGHIASISSFAGLVGLPTAVCYTASKFGVRGFCEGLSLDLYHRNIRDVKVTGIFPYFIDTNPAVKASVLEGCYRKVILDPIKSARVIVHGILRDEEIITLPRNFYFLSYLV
ncbi:uncharacterized oxidoreductase YoxD-like [Culicoides brevitarsis]|uniref:uncharacterized oxidoreductase YoxD-like n=1 Tax=Culicoides brevitarsis TaxID=469753 RepID=UPI00307B28F7